MAQYLTTDGDINQAKRKRAGETVGIGDVPGDPARAARMEAQFAQPVTKVTQNGSSGGGGIGGAVERVKSAYSAVSPLINPVGTAVDALTAAPADALRNSVIRAAGGDPATAEGGETANRDRAFENLMPAVSLAGSIADTVSQGAKGAVLAATGASPAPQVQALPSIAAPMQPASAQGQAKQQPGRQPGRQPSQAAESPFFATESGIAARRNVSGIAEFSNDPTAVSGAQAIPAGGIGGQALRTPGVSNIRDDVPLENRGSINNVGNGIGGFSQNTQGDAALSLGRFERAGEEREKMIQASRRGGIGEGGGRVTVVRDSSRSPTLADMQSARLEGRQVQTEALRAQTEQGILAGADQLMTGQLNRQKTQQDLTKGAVGLESQQRLEQLRAMLADPSLDQDQRAAAEQAYNTLTTPAADRYMTVQGGTNEFGGKDASKVFDRLTGQEVSQGIAGLPAGVDPERALSDARAAIKSGVSRDEVNKRLLQWGLNPI